ncbi:MAG: energy-coupling factor ABC transporter ATP-binding protein, partial [bacterium]|nr:energy-coupling factor ABC transporter ATP-binding protein [bacterium]
DSQMSGFCPTVEEEIAWGLGNLGISREDMRQRSNDMIQLLGLEHIRNSNPLTLSSGQKQRVALASMLALEPKAVLLDEPVSALDPQGRSDVLNYALALAKLGHIVIWATPSLEEASYFPRWLVLDEGRLIYDGAPDMDKAPKALPAPWSNILRCGANKGLWNKQSALTEKETAGFLKEMLGNKDANSSPASDVCASLGDTPASTCNAGETPDGGSASPARDTNAAPDVISAANERNTSDGSSACPAGGTSATPGNAAIIAEDVSFAYSHADGAELALNSINLSIAQGSSTAIIGSNGAGKTTLARLLNGTLAPDQGRVLINGADGGSNGGSDGRSDGRSNGGSDGKNWLNTAEISASRAAAYVGLIPRDPLKQIFAPTVYDEAAFGPINLGFSKEKTALAVKEALEATALSGKASLHPYELNTAELKRLATASILAMQTPVVIFDEPTSSLDAHEAQLLDNILQKLKERQATIIIITHDLDFAAGHCDSIIMLDKGRLIAQAPPSRIFSCVNPALASSLAPAAPGNAPATNTAAIPGSVCPAEAGNNPAEPGNAPANLPTPVTLPCAARLAQSLELPANITSTCTLVGWIGKILTLNHEQTF